MADVESIARVLSQAALPVGLACALAYAIFRWVLPRLNAARAAGGMVRVVERVPLDARRSLYVVEVTGRWLLVASSAAGVQLLAELDARTAEEAEREAARLRPQLGARTSFARGALARRLSQASDERGGGG